MTDRVRIQKEEILSSNWYTLKKVTFDYQKRNCTWKSQSREAYDRGNGAVILLYNKEKLLANGDRAEAEIAANLHGAFGSFLNIFYS